MPLVNCPWCSRPAQIPAVATSLDSSCQFCRRPLWLYKCFSCNKVVAFKSKPAFGSKCPHCFTLVRSEAPWRAPAPAAAAQPFHPFDMFGGIAIDNLSRSIVDPGVFSKLIRNVLERLDLTQRGHEFFANFDPVKAGVDGGVRYPKATVVFKPATKKGGPAMPSVAKTDKLSYYMPSDMHVFAPYLNQHQQTFIKARDLMPQAPNGNALDAFRRRTEQNPEDTYLVVPAYTEAACPMELLNNSGEVIRDAKGAVLSGGSTGLRGAFINLVLSFGPEGSHAHRVQQELERDGKSPAQVTITLPGNSWGSATKGGGGQVDADGKFSYYGQRWDLNGVVLHELLHCYHYVKGTADPIKDPSDPILSADKSGIKADGLDEARAVGLHGYKWERFSENVFRKALNMDLRHDYPMQGIPRDPGVDGFDFLHPPPKPSPKPEPASARK
jgi:hypothetical protein